ncbi:predicted protein [Arabidopsis lyrata subsp. lyrata]|uniref:Predicted protein n=1 Tax=Arabidopsis lyrata subsp. lyrata TaxID=81972 RepID=D7KYJ7_ARALL|nr:predicted protein [Arabidopsis lyrata subsp. lyrata]
MDFGRSRDIISGLPDLGKKNPVISGEDYLEMINERNNQLSTSFMAFVDHVLALQGNSPLHKFSLKFGDGVVDRFRVIRWILKVLERGVSDLELDMHLKWKSSLPSKIFLSETLVRLKLSVDRGPRIDVDDVHLPKLKTLHIESVKFEQHGIGLNKLLSGCHILEELILEYISWCLWEFVSVSSTTLKRLTFCGELMQDENPISVSFDTPNLVYLMFTDVIADEYSKVNFDSLVEAHINLQMSEDQMEEARFSNSEGNLVANATDFIVGICNVKILYLAAYTLEIEKKIDQVKHFLETMPYVEQLILHYNTPIDEDVIEVYQQLQRHPKVASSKCKLQLISDNLSLSSQD